jgi:hypothetical protein
MAEAFIEPNENMRTEAIGSRFFDDLLKSRGLTLVSFPPMKHMLFYSWATLKC